eukprot:9778379-Lingulodinium_polyedra.AAC.1
MQVVLLEWYCIVQSGLLIARPCIVVGIARRGVAWIGAAWHGMAQRGAACRGVAWRLRGH